jgi:hypothetical protein
MMLPLTGVRAEFAHKDRTQAEAKTEGLKSSWR